LEQEGIKGLYRHVMSLPNEKVTDLLEPLYTRLKKRVGILQKDHPDFWAWRAFEQYSANGQHDRGVFSIYWLNLVKLSRGEGIFQGAGIPHAYLEGVNVELMANSDNVLRGGLTPKHIDVEELLANINTEPIVPEVLRGVSDTKSIVEYPVPVPDFALSKLSLSPGEALFYEEKGAAIYFVLEGAVTVNDELYQQGQSCLVVDNTKLQWQTVGTEGATVYKAYVKV
jgi:mannose-6-phosphate isomerase